MNGEFDNHTSKNAEISEEIKEVTEEIETGDVCCTEDITESESTQGEPVATSEDEKSKPKKRSSPFWRIGVLALAAAIIIGAISLGIYSACKLLGGLLDSSNYNESEIGTLGGTNITVNMSDLDVNASELTKATYAAYDSSLLIQAYTDSSATSLASTGSGVLWTSDGYVVTCNHVVEGFTTIKVTFTDGSSYFAEGMATDPATDLALLKITIPEGSTTRPITARNTEKSKLMLGETVIAIGNPLGYLTSTVTDGILSSLERSISVEGSNMVLMQINAAVNSGNSGGGLFDINGSLIGIVNAKISDVDVEGIGFAIPIDTVIDVVSQLASKGYVSGRPEIGIDYAQVTSSNYRTVFSKFPELADYASASSGRWGTTIYPGVYVVGVDSDIKYAEDSDGVLQYGDRIYRLSDEKGNYLTVESGDSIRSILSASKVGDKIIVTVMRNGRTVNVSVILSEKTTA